MPIMRRYRPLPAVRLRDRSCPRSSAASSAGARWRPTTRSPSTTRAFTAALSAIETSYVDKVDSDRLVYGADSRHARRRSIRIRASSTRREYAQMRERQEGRYYGLGITIQAIDGDITASSVFEGSPAYKKGIRRGDVIAKIARRRREGLDRPTRR